MRISPFMQQASSAMQPPREKMAAYWNAAGRGPVRPTVLQALAGFGEEGRHGSLRVVDLGCGIGRDALPLLAMGHHLQAIDQEEAALARLCQACPSGDRARLVPVVARFEDAVWDLVDLAVSSFALPFCPPDRFAALWATIGARLAPGGRIACQLLGPQDDFAGRAGVTIHAQDEVAALAAAYRVEHLHEERSDAVTPRGRAKRWHLFHLVLKKP
jgi:SAM-dependent methyltransferase